MLGFELSPCRAQGSPPAPLAAFFASGSGQSVALSQGPAGGLTVWTEIDRNVAACLRLDNTDPTTRLSWRETLIMELRNVYPVRDLVLTGSWSQLQSSGSGLSDSYTGNRAVSTSSASATATVTVDRAEPYDLWVNYTGRTSGGYCRVEIDGGQSLVNEIDDPAGLGFKAFPTYTATDLQRRQSIKVASGLTGAHTVTLRNGGAASPGGSNLMIEAVAITGSLSEPRVLPPLWQPGTAYTMGDEVQHSGTFYAARATGVSGTTPPSHLSGIASDGALDWRADNRSTYPRFVAIDFASEREYALLVSGSNMLTEIGGQTHGNELLQSRDILLDDAPWVPATTGTGLSLGSQITITENTTWRTTLGDDLADCTLIRKALPGRISHDVTATGTGTSMNVDWLYIGMAPMVRWDGESRSTVADTVAVGADAPVALAGYAGQNPDNLDYPAARRLGISATVDGRALRHGVQAGALTVPGNAINQFDTFLRPNIDATSEGGSLDWKAKAYINGGADGGLTIGAGQVFGFYSQHVLGIG